MQRVDFHVFSVPPQIPQLLKGEDVPARRSDWASLAGWLIPMDRTRWFAIAQKTPDRGPPQASIFQPRSEW